MFARTITAALVLMPAVAVAQLEGDEKPGVYIVPTLKGRSGADRDKLLREGGGNAPSEATVARGLRWLAEQQKPDGGWEFDGESKDRVAATGMALLPFLGAGETHKSGKYQKTVRRGLDFLIANRRDVRDFKGPTIYMYSSGIATLALCEAYGMTSDPALKKPAQEALDVVMAAQGPDGSWGYHAGKNGDTSITGWQIQALKSGKLAKLTVQDAVLDKARKFLVSVSSDSESKYGYRDANSPKASLSAVGLLCRIYIDKWGPRNPSLARGVEHLLKRKPAKDNFDMYYYYYATQVVRLFGGKDWKVTWNPRMRDMLIEMQERRPGPLDGSWPPDQAYIGSNCGRLGTTALAVLTLEVYYRYLPLDKRDNGERKDPDKDE